MTVNRRIAQYFCHYLSITKNNFFFISFTVNQPTRYYSSDIRMSTNRRGRPVLIYRYHSFRKERQAKSGREYWRCLTERCKGRLVVYNGEITKFNDHTLD